MVEWADGQGRGGGSQAAYCHTEVVLVGVAMDNGACVCLSTSPLSRVGRLPHLPISSRPTSHHSQP
jgi:hypothetical protein